MSSYKFAQKPFNFVPPDKGSFPLDHDGVCKDLMMKYMDCLAAYKRENSKCREEIKNYLDCRMNNELMTRESWKNLGSVAALKIPLLVNKLLEIKKVNIKIVTTRHALHFFKKKDVGNVDVLTDDNEWKSWKNRGDPVLHIELTKWADLFVIAPLDANTLGKLANGLCDNLLTCVARAWNMNKPFLFCPAMNTRMYEHPITSKQISTLTSWGYIEIPVVSKMLVCGDKGLGAMAEVDTIIQLLGGALSLFRMHYAVSVGLTEDWMRNQS
ncbi:Phosphopantothenoylcysteine decarboxylase, putative [Pediculus humanus corporis]|uniref:Phosphopantothenoylcysteine decarboxylase, putative n=1 Tax=Pediculus humanus subsp. corporis TaxID=121224 RepID=E0V8V9_PEDHC|nr:Phosphopantothenoylcysteine decarboxylase, putative [Pediculus humanus corporis]EEB09815.1 Phosphopantothenoylcysteine decarboxylase, putative [Pediculus humanus corporis]